MAQSKRMLVVAIDIGTTYSGYAYSFRHEYEKDKLQITTNKVWEDGEEGVRTSYKTPTCVLINPDGEFECFGYEAEARYSKLASDEELKKWMLFRRFKMKLYNTKVSDSMELKSVSRQRFSALSIFSMAIRYLKEHFRQNFRKKVYDSEIQYVLTVPAIWDEGAKQFMRKAATQAGIKSRQLTLALEPEAASVFCKTTLGTNTEDEVGHLDDISKIGTRYIIVDAGGGTVDMTVHEVSGAGKLKELHKVSGGGWGGTQVDDNFNVLLFEIFTRTVIEDFWKNHRSDWLEIGKEFEVNKRKVSGDDALTATFRLPVSLREVFNFHNETSLEEQVKGSRLSEDVRFVGDKMRISGKQMKFLMRPTIQNIVSHVKKILRDPNCTGVSHILLVGGFSESPLLQQMFRQEFPSLNVVTPPDAVLSVVKGAVLFGHDPGAIDARLAPYTYGILACTDFIPGLHDPGKLLVVEGEALCNETFKKFVTVGEEVSYGTETPEQFFTPLHSLHTSVYIPVYKSTEKDPMYTTDSSCSLLGSFAVTVPIVMGYPCRRVGIKFLFGDTEIKVKAQERMTGKEFEVTFAFEAN